jgi:cell division protein FtsA
LLRDNLRHSGMLDRCVAGIVLTGGGSRMPGILDTGDSILRRPLRLAWPMPLAKMPATLAEPEFATVVGMIYYGHRARTARGFHDNGWGTRLKSLFMKVGA